MRKSWPLLSMFSKSCLALILIGAGIMHFLATGFFIKIVPPYLPWPRQLVYVSGVCELILGSLLILPIYSRVAAWGIVALLIAVFPANIYVFQHQEIIPASPLIHLLRLPLQGVMISWAYCYTLRQRF